MDNAPATNDNKRGERVASIEQHRFNMLLHPTLRAHEDKLFIVRMKLLSLTCLSCVLLAPMIIAPYIQLKRYDLAAMTLSFAIIASVGALFIRWLAKPGLAAICLCAGFYGANVAGFFYAGGVSSPAGYWFAVIPMIALFFHGRQHGFAWFGIGLLTYCSLALAETMGWINTTTVFSGNLLLQYNVSVGVGFIFVVGGITFSSEALRAVLLERAVQEEQRLSSVLQAAKDNIIIVDKDNHVALMNQSAKETFTHDDVHTLLNDPELDEHEWLEHEQRAYSISLTTVDDEHFHRIAVLRDETERRQTARALERARDEAFAASRAKSQFLANMSHELRTPLNAIIGYSEIIEEDLLDDGQEDQPWFDDILKVNQAGTHLLSLISGVLDLSKIEAGHMQINIESIHLPNLLNEVITTCKTLANTNQNTLNLTLDLDLEMLETDRTKLRQILLNLISNAAKFTHNGQITLRATSTETHVVFDVQDTGIGIAEEDQSKVFKAFEQVDSSSTREYGGTGLGLTLVKELTSLLGGEVLLQSRLGKGSTFTVQLPRHIKG